MMILKIIKWTFLAVLGLVFLLVVVVFIGSKAPLDDDYTHTREVDSRWRLQRRE
jgi:uncharacterized protein YpmS